MVPVKPRHKTNRETVLAAMRNEGNCRMRTRLRPYAEQAVACAGDWRHTGKITHPDSTLANPSPLESTPTSVQNI